MERRIIFFDIDGTITSEIDRQVPESAKDAIRRARANGHLMYINTGRCFQNVEQRFREVGFDGYICGCGTDIYCGGERLSYHPQKHEMVELVRKAAAAADVDLLFESSVGVTFNPGKPLRAKGAFDHLHAFQSRGYDLSRDPMDPDFFFDKFVIWLQTPESLEVFRSYTDPYFTCIDRGGVFREFVPRGYSKATGIQFVLDHYGLPLDAAYAIGDSNNDLEMLNYVPHSIAMGNSQPEELKSKVEFVTKKSSEGGIAYALETLGFFG